MPPKHERSLWRLRRPSHAPTILRHRQRPCLVWLWRTWREQGEPPRQDKSRNPKPTAHILYADERRQVGTDAPPFEVKDQDGKEVTLESFKGQKNVVVFFYPKDNTVSYVASLSSSCAVRRPGWREALLTRKAEKTRVSAESFLAGAL